MYQDRRRFLRVMVPNTVANTRLVAKETKGSCEFEVWPVKDISMTGIGIKSNQNITGGAEAFLNIDLEKVFKTIGVVAKVMWCVKNQSGYELGLHFEHWDKDFDDRKAVSDYIRIRILEDRITGKFGERKIKFLEYSGD